MKKKKNGVEKIVDNEGKMWMNQKKKTKPETSVEYTNKNGSKKKKKEKKKKKKWCRNNSR